MRGPVLLKPVFLDVRLPALVYARPTPGGPRLFHRRPDPSDAEIRALPSSLRARLTRRLGILPPADDAGDAEGVPASARAFFDREVKPHVPDAWVDTARRDPKDGRMGVIGYEINFNRTFTFNRYIPPRPLDEIEAATRAIKRTTSSGDWRR